MPKTRKELTKNQVALLTSLITSITLIVVALITGVFNKKPANPPTSISPVVSPVFNNQINTNTNIDTSKKKSIKSENKTINAKNVNTGVNNGIIGDNGVQNFGIQPRIITEQSEAVQFFLSNYPDKTIRVQFVAPIQEGEIINVKNQIIKILISKGYSNIENIPGIRLLLDPTAPIDRIGLLNNTSGGITFHIPPALK